MFRFGVKNLRRLRDVDPIEIRPITVLVGRNSSGKSTFLRAFPLIRQSLMTRTSSPILWYGDLVDFGEYETAVSDGAVDNKITFRFGLDEVRLPRRNYHSAGEAQAESIQQIDVDLSISHQGGKVRLESLSMVYDKGLVKFDVKLDQSGIASEIIYNGKPVLRFLDNARIVFSLGALFPEVSLRAKKADQENFLFDADQWFFNSLRGLVKTFANKKIGDEQLYRFTYLISMMRSFSPSELMKVERSIDASSLKKIVADLRGSDSFHIKDQVQTIFEIRRWMRCAPAIFSALRNLLGSALYIGPVRARSERYYRYQDLAVSEIDPDGKNFPMFLNSLSLIQRNDFSDWVRDRFGYGVEVQQHSGHISIALKVGRYSTNIVDNGYGISQVLPVLGQIWWASRGANRRSLPPRRPTGALLVIEQPELHLHPAHQALIADAIVGERAQRKTEDGAALQFVIETHSEALINRLGELIAAGKVPASDVQVILFDADGGEEDRETQIKISRFKDNGTLMNWPYGFFQPVI